MVLFLGVPKQGLMDEKDIFQQICKFLLVFASSVRFQFHALYKVTRILPIYWFCVTKRITPFTRHR